MLTLWGFVNLVLIRNRGLLTAQALLSFVPLVMALFSMFNGLASFLEMASAAGAGPRPEVMANTVVHAIACGIFGAASTGVPAVIGIAALSRSGSSQA